MRLDILEVQLRNLRITIFTFIPSPYQVELFNALACIPNLDISVAYYNRSDNDHAWAPPKISHKHCYFDDGGLLQIRSWVQENDLVVFSGYQRLAVRRLMKLRHSLGLPWAFWGERPGFRSSGWIGRKYRGWALSTLRRSEAPIWGIGQWAVDGYLAELGNRRPYFNVPYSSDLCPFFRIERNWRGDATCRFLFSGQFIRRKGVDLLVSAFTRLLREDVPAELHLIGNGPLKNKLEKSLFTYASRVQFHGFRQWDERADIYAAADILCAPSRYDGWGLVVPEGLASGMPVISSDRTGAARELIDKSNGWLVKAGDQNDLFLKMKAAATMSGEDGILMSRHARQAAERQHVDAGVERFTQAVNATLEAWEQSNRSTANRVHSMAVEHGWND